MKNLEERKGQHQRITGNRGKLRIKALKIQADAIEHRNPGLFDDFIGWLGEQNWITDISSGTLDPEQPVYQKFLAYMGLPDVDRERRDHRFKILTESKAERRERQEREGREAEAKRAQKEREDREWPEAFGWAFEQVEGGLRKDEASRSKIKDIVIRLRHRCPETWREVFQSFARAVGERYREQERRRAEGQRLPPLSILIDRSWDEITEENPT